MRRGHQHPATLPRGAAAPAARRPRPPSRCAGTRPAPSAAVVLADARADLLVVDRHGARRPRPALPASGYSAVRRSRLLGLPTSMAEASVATLGRGASAGLQIIGNRAVGVVREHDLADGQAHLRAPTGGDRVAEVAARDDERGALARAAPDAKARGRVVDRLRQQPAEVDAVGGGELRLRAAAADPGRLPSPGAGSRRRCPRRPGCARCRPSRSAAAPASGTPGPSGNRTTTSMPGPAVEGRRHRAAGVARRSPPGCAAAACCRGGAAPGTRRGSARRSP